MLAKMLNANIEATLYMLYTWLTEIWSGYLNSENEELSQNVKRVFE